MQPSSCWDFSTKALAVAMISSRSSGFTLTNMFKRIMACLFVIVWAKVGQKWEMAKWFQNIRRQVCGFGERFAIFADVKM